MHDDRERDQPAGGTTEGDEETAEEFETAPSGGLPPIEEPRPSLEEPPSVPEPPAGEPPAGEPPADEARPVWPAEDTEGSADEVGDAAPSSQAAARLPTGQPALPIGEPDLPPREAEAYPAPAAAPPPPTEAAHTVPATQVGESTQCPRCGTENRPGVAFCRNCGQRLVAAGVPTTVERPGTPEGTQQCPRCGTYNRAGVAFCQNCGANLRAAAPQPGYGAPPAATAPVAPPAARSAEPARGGAVLGPIVLLVAAIGVVTAFFLPFPYGDQGSLWARSFGEFGGYGIAFWGAYPSVNGGLLDQAYFGFAAASPILAALLVLLAIGGFLRAAPGGLQVIGLLIALLWAIGLAGAFIGLEVAGNWTGDVVGLLRSMSPSGIIFLLSSLVVVIGVATRLARS